MNNYGNTMLRTANIEHEMRIRAAEAARLRRRVRRDDR